MRWGGGERAIKAKKNVQIDAFLLSSTTDSYLAVSVDSL